VNQSWFEGCILNGAVAVCVTKKCMYARLRPFDANGRSDGSPVCVIDRLHTLLFRRMRAWRATLTYRRADRGAGRTIRGVRASC